MWSKDIVFVLSDGYSEGASAWLDAYQGYDQSSAYTILASCRVGD